MDILPAIVMAGKMSNQPESPPKEDEMQAFDNALPRIDRSVEHVGVSRLRKLNSEDLKSMDKTLVLQENDQPLAVLLTYEKYLVLQDKLDSLMRTIYVLSNPEESAALRSGIEDVNGGRTRELHEIKVGSNKKR
jgi:PHD/YefM family antitoxin component YafN of YafNO toxin-antitoxin module